MLVLPSQTRISQPRFKTNIDRSNWLSAGLTVAATPVSAESTNAKLVDHCGTQTFYDPYGISGGPSFIYYYDGQYLGIKHQNSPSYKYTGNSRYPIRASSVYSLTLICKFVTAPSNSTNLCSIEGIGTWKALVISTSATGSLQLTTTNGTAIDSGITPSIGTLYTLTGVIGNGQMEFFVNGLSVGTSSSSVGNPQYLREIITNGGAISAEVVYAVIAHTTKLSSNAVLALYNNPWQIFQPDRRSIFLPATAVTLTYLRPSADISTGSWTPSTGTSLYAVLDEVTPSDADYILASTATTCEIQLSAGTTPPSRDNHALNYHLLAGTGTVTVVLKCGTTTIKTWNHTLTGSTQDISSTLTNAEASSITDYSNLRVVFTSS